jgi:hypothetical protein
MAQHGLLSGKDGFMIALRVSTADGISRKPFFRTGMPPSSETVCITLDAKETWVGTMKGNEYDMPPIVSQLRSGQDIAVGDIHADKREYLARDEEGLWGGRAKKTVYTPRNGILLFKNIFKEPIRRCIAERIYFTRTRTKFLNPFSRQAIRQDRP